MNSSGVWLILTLVGMGVSIWRTIRLVIIDGYGTNPPPRSHPLREGVEGPR